MKNYSAAILLVNNDVRLINCLYGETKSDRSGPYTFKTLDASIDVDDHVVVPTDTRHGMTVVKVVAVDIDPDFEADFDYKWVVSRVDRASYDLILSQEQEVIAKIRRVEIDRKRQAMQDIMGGLDAFADMKALPLVTVGEPSDATSES